MREKPLEENSSAMILPCASSAARPYAPRPALSGPRHGLIAHILHAHRSTGELRHDRGISRCVARVVTAIGARTRHPDRTHLFRRNAETARHAQLREMRLLRARPDRGGAVGFDIGNGAGRTHAGMDWNGHS